MLHELNVPPFVDALKLRPPASRPGVVARPRLARLQEAALQSRLVLISAPAGYGKSTLAAQWSERDPRGPAWVHLDRRDDDVVVLLSDIAAALAREGTDVRDLLDELSRGRPRVDQVALPALAAALEDGGPFALVIEDADRVTSAASRAVLAFLVDHVPAGSQLTLVTRGDLDVPLARVRASGELFVIGTDALALTAEETRAVAESGGLDLTEAESEALRERTEGWAAAVVLAALVLGGHERAGERAAGLSGSQQQIADYLIEEVLDAQPDHLAEFLLGTSILDRLTAPLCNAVLEVDDAAASLATLRRANTFVIPLDDRGECFRYHHLFGDLLRAELERRHPERLAAYRSRAAHWCEQHGRADEAFVHAHAAGDLAQLGRIALANRDRFTQRGQSETVRLWFDQCTDEEIAAEPQLSIAAAWAYGYQGDEARARRFIAAAEQGALDVPSVDGALSLRSSLWCLRAAVAPDGIGQMLRDAERVCAAEEPARTRWYFSGLRAIGIAYVLLGRPEEAVAPLRGVISTQRAELAGPRVMCLGYMAFAAMDLGDARDAHRWAARASMAVADDRLEGTLFSAIAATAAMRAQIDRGDHLTASRLLEDVRRARPLLRAARWLDADLALRCAQTSLDLGDRPAAVELARVADDVLQGYPDAGVLPMRLTHLQERIRQGREFELTAAELRLFHFLPTYLSLQEIAERLHLSRATVKTQVASIYAKLGVEGRSEAVEAIDRLGLGTTSAGSAREEPAQG